MAKIADTNVARLVHEAQIVESQRLKCTIAPDCPDWHIIIINYYYYYYYYIHDTQIT